MAQKRVLVTGSSRGIGRAIAFRLATDGYQVAVHYGSQRDQAQATLAGLPGAGHAIYEADLTAPANAASLIERVVADGPLDALVNNAGVYLPMDFAKSGDGSFDAVLHRTFAVNFESPVRLIRAALPHLEARHGAVLNVASRVGFKGEGGAALYAASKAALISITRSLAVELASKKIAFFGMAPGWVDTAMARDGMSDRLESILETIPLGRMATPDDCAAVAAFLLKDEARYLSGITIDINGASYFH